MENERTSVSSTSFEDLIALAECVICRELKTSHRLIPCGHSFCWDDLEVLAKGKSFIICPLCQKSFVVPVEGIDSFVVDWNKNAFVDSILKFKDNGVSFEDMPELCCGCELEATVYCQKCKELFCDDHAKQTHSIGALKSHPLVSSSSKAEDLCLTHNKRLKSFCNICQISLCTST